MERAEPPILQTRIFLDLVVLMKTSPKSIMRGLEKSQPPSLVETDRVTMGEVEALPESSNKSFPPLDQICTML
jgi:hypothetical protein